MTNETKPHVEIQADQGVQSLGKSAYLAAKDGKFDSSGFHSSTLVMVGIVIMIFSAMYFTKDPDRYNGF